MNAGFLPALGTPLNQNGDLCVESFQKQIRDQIAAGAVGVLCMGSMGQQAHLRQSVCPLTAKAALEAAAGQVPVFVGAMDVSIARTKERIAAMEILDVSGFVLTAPYYAPCSREQMMNYFKQTAAATRRNILVYDLPGVTQAKITYDMVLELLRDVPNFIGIKSADLQMFRKLTLNSDVPRDFIMVYSGLDTFDIAYKWGINKCLDGMCACTPHNTGALFRAMSSGDYKAAAACLNNIVSLRDTLLEHDLWPSFSAVMNMLGYEGNFAPDYCSPLRDGMYTELHNLMVSIGEVEV